MIKINISLNRRIYCLLVVCHIFIAGITNSISAQTLYVEGWGFTVLYSDGNGLAGNLPTIATEVNSGKIPGFAIHKRVAQRYADSIALANSQGREIEEVRVEYNEENIIQNRIIICTQPEDGLYGYATLNGDVVLSPQYNHIDYIKSGRAIVKKGRFYGFIDTEGKPCTPVEYEDAGNWTLCGALVMKNKRMFLLTSDGKLESASILEKKIHFTDKEQKEIWDKAVHGELKTFEDEMNASMLLFDIDICPEQNNSSSK